MELPLVQPTRRVWLWLIAIVLLGLVARIWTIAHTTVTSRDNVVFIQIANNFTDPPLKPDGTLVTRAKVLEDAHHPPGFPMLLWLAHQPVKWVMGVTPDSWLLAGQIVSVIAGCLLVIPLYYMGRTLFSPLAGLLAALFAITLPVFGEVGADGISDATFLLMATTSLAQGVRAFSTRCWRCFFGLGLAIGTAYLIRQEGMILLVAAGATLLGTWILGDWGTRRIFLLGVVTLLGFFLFAGPYIAIIGKLSNKPSGRVTENAVEVEQAKIQAATKEESSPSAEPTKTKIPRGQKLLLDLIAEPGRTTNYALGVFGIGGIIAFRNRIRAESKLAFLIIVGVLWYWALAYLGYRSGYIARRHALVLAMIACVFSAGFLPLFAEWVSRNAWWPKLRSPVWIGMMAVLIAGAGYPMGFKRLHANRTGHRLAGEWAAQNIPVTSRFIDPFTYSEYFAGRSYRMFPDYFVDPHSYADDVVYAVVEPRNPNPGMPSYFLGEAKKVAARGELVFQWPEGEIEKASVAIYKAKR